MAAFDAELQDGAEAKGPAANSDNVESKTSKKPLASALDRSPGTTALQDAVAEDCLWDKDILFKDQLEIMQTLERINEHMIAATLSVPQCKELDSVAVIVNGCICAVGDAVMRRRATDHPSEVCTHLFGQCRDGQQLGLAGFGLSVSSFATQTATIELHQPELCVARTAVLDYFLSPQQARLQKIFTWEDEPKLRPTMATIKYLRNVCREIAAPLSDAHQLLLTGDPKVSLLHVNYPELKAYQNMCFFWKFLLNPDIDARAPFAQANRSFHRMEAQLVWHWQNLEYNVQCFGGQQLTCAPPVRLDATGKPLPPPTHRYPSTATPSFYLPAPEVKTEDDVIYRPNLPGFQDMEDSSAVLGQRDSELLLSYLTVPYLRLPLVVTFFSTDDRVHKLESKKLRDILDSVLFEPGVHLKLWMIGVAPVVVPTKHPDLLASPYGLMLNELCHSPVPVMDAIMRLVQGALALDTGTVTTDSGANFNSGVKIILYIVRLGARVDNYLSFLIQHVTNTHATINAKDFTLRGVHISTETLETLKQARTKLRVLLFGRFLNLIDSYLKKLDREIVAGSAKVGGFESSTHLLSAKSILACNLHTHKLLLLRNVRIGDDLVKDAATTSPGTSGGAPAMLEFSRIVKNVLSSFVYLTTRHTWKGNLLVPENEMYEVLAVQRRRLIAWCNTRFQGPLDHTMQASLEIATSAAGAYVHRHVDTQNRWSKISGGRCGGRFAVASTRSNVVEDSSAKATAASLSPPDASGDDSIDNDTELLQRPMLTRQQSWEAPVGVVSEAAFVGVELDLQLGQMTLRSRHLSALDAEILGRPDVQTVFGACGTIQASQLTQASDCVTYRLVGLKHELSTWSAETNPAPMSEQWERQYDPSELFPTEKWVSNLFEPVRRAFFNGPQPPAMTFLMPAQAIPAHAEVVVLLGEHQMLGGPFKLVYLFRRLKCVHVYECLSHGRQWWYSLHLTTDTRFTLRDMQISTAPRQNGPDPYWWERGSGVPYPSGVSESLCNDHSNNSRISTVIVRDATHEQNLSGGRETFIPSRLLYGAVPDCILEEYRFWQDESSYNWKSSAPLREQAVYHRRLRGYAVNADKTDHMIIVEFGSVGDWNEFLGAGTGGGDVLEAPPAAMGTAGAGDAGEFDKTFKQRRSSAVLESTQMPGRGVRIYR